MKTNMLIILIWLLPMIGAAAEKYELRCLPGLLEESMKIAIDQAGTLESGKNSGAVEKYLESVGLKPGNPYCAAGQYYCFLKAALKMGLSKRSIPIPRTGLANAIFTYAKRNGSKVQYKAAVHDLLIYRKGSTRFGHVERIIETGRAGWVKTIAFNVSGIVNGKKREGVFIRKRNIYHPLAAMFVRGLVGFRERD